MAVLGNGQKVGIRKSLPKSDMKPFIALTTEPLTKYNNEIKFMFHGEAESLDGICFGLISEFRAKQIYFVDNYRSET